MYGVGCRWFIPAGPPSSPPAACGLVGGGAHTQYAVDDWIGGFDGTGVSGAVSHESSAPSPTARSPSSSVFDSPSPTATNCTPRWNGTGFDPAPVVENMPSASVSDACGN